MSAHDVDAAAHYTPLGSISSSAAPDALLMTLQTLRPQWHIRLTPLNTSAEPRYRVEIDSAAPPLHSPIDAWLNIKSALMAAFPADKPHAVTAIDP